MPEIDRMLHAQPDGPATVKVRLTLGPALIDLEATLEQIVVVVTRLTQEFGKASIITSLPEELGPAQPRTP